MTVKIMIMGHSRHGKDTLAELISKQSGMSFSSSSRFACERVVYPALKDEMGYDTAEACFEDRHNHRARWYELINAYCGDDKARLTREIFSEHDIYCGIRNREEFLAAEAELLFDFSIWVDASQRLPAESHSSCTVAASDADFVVDNNGSADQLFENYEQALIQRSKELLQGLSNLVAAKRLSS